MNTLATITSKAGFPTQLAYDLDAEFSDLARGGEVDAFIVATEDGYSPLGKEKQFLADELGISVAEVSALADWNRFKNPRVSLIALGARRSGHLRGVILAPCETSECYKQFAEPLYGKPYRDFYYNVTFEAIAHATQKWRARRLAISHLSASLHFNEVIANCTAEALVHFVDSAPFSALDTFAFVGCCITQEHLKPIEALIPEAHRTSHHPIQVEHELRDGAEIVHLSWG